MVTLNEQVKVYWLLSKLPLSYRPHISTIITTTADTDMTVEKVKAKLTSEETIRGTSIGSSETAARISKTKPKLKGPCSHCGSQTHHESTCYKKHPHLKPKGNGKPNGKGGKRGQKANK